MVNPRAERRVWVLGTTGPALVFLAVVAYLPIAYAVALSFFKKTAFNPAMKWVGVDNYRVILEEPELWNAFGRSVLFTVGSVALQLALGLVAALLLNRAFRGLNVVRSLFVLPYLLPSIVVALVFQWLLSPEYGVVNQVLMQTGLVARPINFFGGLGTAMWAVIGMAGWQYGSFATLLILARLQAINPKLYEAAAVSGAGPLRAFWDVTLPALRTTLLVIALLRGIWMFNKFDSIWLVTHGGPLKHTETLPLYAYRLAFEEFDFGLAAAACSVMFVVLLVGAVLYFKLFDPTREIEVGR